jgi:hypothetical protein
MSIDNVRPEANLLSAFTLTIAGGLRRRLADGACDYLGLFLNLFAATTIALPIRSTAAS